jgi:hypothetical protein
MHAQELDRILRGLGSVMDSLTSGSNIVTMHDCLNPTFSGQIDRNTLRTSLPHKCKRTSWSIEDTKRFVDQIDDMINTQLGELFGRSLTQIGVEGRKSNYFVILRRSRST